MNTHLAFMQRAIALSENGCGRTAPNPIVGAVIVATDGSVIAEGFHDRLTAPDHAEVVALKIAGDKARGAMMYVTLEPCNHTGTTGPCAQAIIDAGITTLIYAVADPERLVDIRKNRLNTLSEEKHTSYVDLDKIKEELEESKKIFKLNNIPIIDVTRKSVEETAASIIKIHEIKNS